MKKVVVKLAIHDYKEKQKALKAVSSLSGINSISVDMKEEKLTVIGNVDPVDVVSKLRKSWHADIVSVGPVKEKTGGGNNEKKNAGKDEEDDENRTEAEEINAKPVWFYDPNHNHYMIPCYVMTPNCVVCQAEENPYSCVIC